MRATGREFNGQSSSICKRARKFPVRDLCGHHRLTSRRDFESLRSIPRAQNSTKGLAGVLKNILPMDWLTRFVNFWDVECPPTRARLARTDTGASSNI